MMQTGMKTEFERIVEAYRAMAEEANYRPAAPGDGFGSVLLTEAELKDENRLRREAEAYASRFTAEEDTLTFYLGCTDWDTNRAAVYAIEAVRLLNAGVDGQPFARKLLRMAITELDEATVG